MAQSGRDENRVPTLLGISSVDGITPTTIYVSPTTHRVLASLEVTDITAINGLKDDELVNADNQGFMALGTDGTNYQVISTDSSGNLQVDILNASLAVTGTFWQATQPVSLASVPSHAVTNAGTFAVQVDGAALTALQLIDNAISGAGFNITQFAGAAVPIGAGVEATALRVTLATDSTGVISVDDNGGILTVDGTVTANLGTTDNAVLDAIQAATEATQTSLEAGGVIESLLDGVETVLGTIDADTGAIKTAVEIMDDWDNIASDGASVSGDVAHDGADAGEPVKVGMKAVAHGTNPTAVAAADRTNWYANRAGIPFMIGGHPNIVTKQLNVTDADGAQTDTALVSVDAGSKIVVTHIAVTCDNANTVDVGVRIGFGTANTPANDAAGIILSHPGIAAGSGLIIGSGTGIIGIGGDGADLRVTCEDPVTGAIDIVVGYYTIES